MRHFAIAASSFPSLKHLVLNARRGPASLLRRAIPSRSLAQLRHEPFHELWFTPSSRPLRSPAEDLLDGGEGNPNGSGDRKPTDERTVRLGKST